jgi:hypothetical protein
MHRSQRFAIFKCIMEVMFCEAVQHRLRFRLDDLGCVKMAVFQFYLQSTKQKKVRWMADGSYDVFAQTFTGR